jgi:Uma2 family endonuclease
VSRARGDTLRSRPGSLADLEALGDDARAELIDGVLYELPMTSFGHGYIAGCILAALWPVYQVGSRKGPGGWWLQPENDFLARGREVVRPDLLGWRKTRLPQPPPQQRARVVPDWVCEIISPSTRRHDLLTKRDAYARIGVRHRWYVDPEVRVLQTFELSRGQWIETGAFTEDDVVEAAPFEAVALRMADWWATPPKPTKTRSSRAKKPAR